LPERSRPNLELEPSNPVNGWDGGHEHGPAPSTTDALMRGGGPKKEKWLRHGDWEIAATKILTPE